MELFERIKKLCKENGKSIKQVEADLGYSNGSLSKGNNNIKAERLQQLADYFEVSIDYLLTGEIKEGYYLDKAAAATMQMLFDSPGKKALFDAMETMTDEEAKAYADLHRRLTNGNNESN